ncbi:MAG: hypothetical protein IPK14_06590 [Blastocatellia bacterium]|nr:hypothetical protein [Blastocatellia bacterium]MBL8196896.1 hypothetical protein [Blastocatellia bacterium]
MVKVWRFFLVFLFLVTFNSLAFAYIDPEVTANFTWSEVGPDGGDVRALAIDPADANRLFIGTNDGQIYRSTNAAKSWTRLLSFHHPGYVVDKIIIDNKSPKIIYVPLWSLANDVDGTIYKSTDGGDTWQELTAMNKHSVRALAIAPTDANLLIAAAIDGAYISHDAGTSWSRFSPENHPDIKRLHSIAIDPKNPNIVYLGTEHLPWRTDNGGKDWVCVKGHPTEKKQQFIDDSDIFTITIDPTDNNNIYASACSGIYNSKDGATTWTKYQGIPFTSRRTHIIYPDPTNNQIIYSGTTEGLWKTTDAGQTWRLMSSIRTIVNSITIHPSNPNRIYLGVKSGGVWVSDNAGESFQASNNGFVNRQISALLSDRSVSGRIYAAALFNGFDGGLYLSTDGGSSWKLSSKGLANEDIYSIYQSPWDEKLLYAGTNLGLYFSKDRGESWVRITGKSVPIQSTPSKTTPNKTTPNKTTKTYKTKNVASKSKKPLPSANITQRVVELIANDANKSLLVAAWSGLYQVNEDGRIEKLNVANYNGKILSVAFDSKEKVLYAGTQQGLYRSSDNGKTWQIIPINDTNPVVQAINVSPHNGNVIMVTTDTTCFFSNDGAKTWQRRGKGIPYGEPIAVRFSSKNPNVIIVGDYRNGGVYLSTDAGENFYQIDRQITSNRIGAISFDNFDADRVYVGSFSGGIYVLKTPGLSSITNNTGQ